MSQIPFLDQLEQVERGERDLKMVVSEFLPELEAMMAELDESVVEHPYAAGRATGELLQAIGERFADCHGLACDILEDPQPGDLARLRQSHQALENALLAFQEACWSKRGPTGLGWANRIVEALEEAAAGISPGGELEGMIEVAVRELERRGAEFEPGGSGRELLAMARTFSDWAQGVAELSLGELQDRLDRLPELVEILDAWWRSTLPAGNLRRLIAVLDGAMTAANVLPLARATLIEVTLQKEGLGALQGRSSSRAKAIIGTTERTLDELELTLKALVEDLRGRYEWDFRDQLEDLCEDLAEHLLNLRETAEREGQTQCLACARSNPREAKRCRYCAKPLPPPVGEDWEQHDPSEELPEWEVTRRLRLACQAFRRLRLGPEELAMLLEELRGRVEQLATRGPAECQGLVGELRAALDDLAEVEVAADAQLVPALERFISAADRLGADFGVEDHGQGPADKE